MADPRVAYAAYLRRVTRNRRRPALALLAALVVIQAIIGAFAHPSSDTSPDQPQLFGCNDVYSRIVLKNNYEYRPERMNKIRLEAKYEEAERALHEEPSKKNLEDIDKMNKKINNLRLEILNLGNEYISHTECNAIDRANIKSVVDDATNDN
jgi:hypothetical protein